MKRLFKIGSGLFVYSIVPILSWIVLSIILKNSLVANVFSLTYALQFIWAFLKHLFASGANIRAEKEKNVNSVSNGIFWGSIFALIIFLIPAIFIDKYISFFGQDVDFYKPFVLYSIAQLFLQTLLSLNLEKLYFENKESQATLHLIIFNLLNFFVLILSCLIIKQTWIALIITLVVLLIYVAYIYIINFKKFKIDFTFYKNIKYESSHLASNIFMLIIYLFGYKIVFSAGEQYLIALNICGLCTDAYWDTISAISTAAKVDLAKGNLKYKNSLKVGYMFTAIIILLSFVSTSCVALIQKADFGLVMIFLSFQIFDMLLTPFILIFTSIIQIDYSPTFITVLEIISKIIRTVISIIIISPFCTDIAQITQSMILVVVFIILRFSMFKNNGSKLEKIKKQKNG